MLSILVLDDASLGFLFALGNHLVALLAAAAASLGLLALPGHVALLAAVAALVRDGAILGHVSLLLALVVHVWKRVLN